MFGSCSRSLNGVGGLWSLPKNNETGGEALLANEPGRPPAVPGEWPMALADPTFADQGRIASDHYRRRDRNALTAIQDCGFFPGDGLRPDGRAKCSPVRTAPTELAPAPRTGHERQNWPKCEFVDTNRERLKACSGVFHPSDVRMKSTQRGQTALAAPGDGGIGTGRLSASSPGCFGSWSIPGRLPKGNLETIVASMNARPL